MKAATYYVTDYSGKIQPHSHELWLHLHRGHARLEAELGDANAPSSDVDPRYRASRGLLRMALSAEKKQHKSFQEMVATLLGEPESICSHSFQRLYYSSTLSTACRAQPENCASADLPAASVPGYIALPADTTGSARPRLPVFFFMCRKYDFHDVVTEMLHFHACPSLSRKASERCLGAYSSP